MRPRSGLVAVLLGIAAAGASADVSVQATVDRQVVGVGDPFRLTVAVSGAGGGVADPQIPSVPNLEVYAAGRSQNVSIVNGSMSQSVVFQYSLVARAPGRVVVPSVAIAVQGKIYATDAIPVTVGAAAPGSPGAGAPAGPRPFFATAEASRRRAWVGEQLVYTLKLFCRAQLLNGPTYQPPDLQGFVAEPLPQRQYQAAREGATYQVFEVRYALFPVGPGAVTIPPATFQINVAQGGADPLAAFFGQGRGYAVKTEAVPVVVQPLPEAGRPPLYSGAVGAYRVKATLDHASIEAGRPVALTFEIAGRGLVKSLREPAWPDMPSFRRYETVAGVDARSTAEGLEGSKTFRTVLIPSASGRMTIPAIAYPVFDPEARRYVTLRTPPLALAVKPGTGVASAPAGPATPGTGTTRLLNQDIRFLKPLPGAPGPAGSPVERPAYWLLQAVPAAFLLSGFLAAGNRRRAARDVAGARARLALRGAERRLAAAGEHARRGDVLPTHAALHDALVNYLGDRWGVAPAGLTLADTAARLAARGVPDEAVRRVRALWEEADLIRYAPQAAAGEAPGRRVEEARALLQDLEARL